MSLNEDLLMELLDGEIPEPHRKAIEARLSADPISSNRLRVYRSIRKLMQAGDELTPPRYDESCSRLRERLQNFVFRPRRAVSTQWILAAASLLFVFVLIVNPKNGSQLALFKSADVNLENSSEFSDYDPNLIDLLTVSQPERPAENNNSIDVQVNVQDMEQLLVLLQETRNFKDSIHTLTIQLPDGDGFELFGESQLMYQPQMWEDQ